MSIEIRALRRRRASIVVLASWVLATQPGYARDRLNPLETLGKQIFFENISNPETLSCSSCHDPDSGWTTPRSDAAVMPGAVAERFGNRKPPSNAYIVFSPVRDIDERTGGALWDARADGTAIASLGLDGVDQKLLGPAADQSILPFTNTLEHNTTAMNVCSHVEENFGSLYAQAWGKAIDCGNGLEESFARIGLSIVAYEASDEVSPFASRFDAGALSPLERRGFELFTGEATCSGCHTVTDSAQPGDGSQQLFTSFKTFNIGTPRNPDNPFFSMDSVLDEDGSIINSEGAAFVDVGDGGGRVKTPTLRNVAKKPFPGFVKRFTHNGYFDSLEGIVHFYNTRDIKPVCPFDFDVDEALAAGCWPEPENSENLAGAGTDNVDIGNLGLSQADERAIVAFLRTLSDLVNVTPPDPTGRDHGWRNGRRGRTGNNLSSSRGPAEPDDQARPRDTGLSFSSENSGNFRSGDSGFDGHRRSGGSSFRGFGGSGR